ncbi:nucleotidyltransferase domain-containing protein [Cellulosimicrobium sp. Marseille-Q4280]|uniref:nucleotidyltransferase domain-containing protein n=1 Tax=Cellulosimicrobium sp. Marseille-Q4280 TaxID=2937992 RepID=UPI00203E7C60|nr:nucleotidyltransferase domain-containing protein [Cellulosimicrobium sp. Marseille-Q4280]
MRAVPDSLDPEVVRRVDARLDAVVRDERVAIPLAVESGSQAWGFPSPDSDYDCRFLYVRSRADYLDPWPARDVVETPLDAVLDVNGWDLLKAVRLMVRGNATVTEWLRSRIVYRGDDGFRAEMLRLAEQVVNRDDMRRHYLHVALAQGRRHGAGDDGALVAGAGAAGPRLKTFFYVLRPAAALRWLRVHDGAVAPPIDLLRLLEESAAPGVVVRAAADLVARKAVTREAGTGTVPGVLARFVEDELDRARTAVGTARNGVAADGVAGKRAAARETAAEAFRGLVDRYAPDVTRRPAPTV